VLLWLERRAQSACALPPGRRARGSAEAQPVACAVAARWLAWLVCVPAGAAGLCAAGAFMLRPLAADWSVLPWGRFAGWAWNSLRLGGISAVLAVALALLLAFCGAPRPDGLTAAWCAGRPGLCGARRGDCGGAAAAGGLAAGRSAPESQWGYCALVTATVLGIVWAYLVRFCAVALQSVQSGYARIPASLDDSARMLGTAAWG
jgi:iron(III) transport system permease protein